MVSLFGRVYDYGAETEEQSAEQETQDWHAAMGQLTHGHDESRLTQAYYLLPEGEPQTVGYYRLLKIIESELSAFRPDEVVGPSENDLNQDHRHLADALAIALRPANMGSVKRHLKFIALDGHPRSGNWYEVLTDSQLASKITAVEKYRRERRSTGPRSPRGLRVQAEVWGSACGSEYAEAYELAFCRGEIQ